ncbi:MAG: 50S ribosomal protein L15, partial [Thermoproteota archaeon]
MPTIQDKTWIRLLKENTSEIRDRVVEWRKENAIIRIDRPSRLQ